MLCMTLLPGLLVPHLSAKVERQLSGSLEHISSSGLDHTTSYYVLSVSMTDIFRWCLKDPVWSLEGF